MENKFVIACSLVLDGANCVADFKDALNRKIPLEISFIENFSLSQPSVLVIKIQGE